MSEDLPEGWHPVVTSDLFTFVTSGSRGWARYYAESGARFLRIGNLAHNTIAIDLRNTRFVQPPLSAEGVRTLVREGDILVSITADVGMIGLVQQGLGQAFVNQHLALARPVDGIDRNYLAWYLASKEGQTQFQELQRGATKVGLGLDDIRSIVVPLAPLAEQRRIVAKLDALLARVDACRQLLDKIPKLLARFRQSVLAAACSGRLTEDWPRNLSGDTTGGNLPNGWAWIPLRDYVDNFDSQRVPIAANLRQERKGHYPYYGASGVIDSIDNFTHDGDFILIGEDGANLLSRSTPIAFLATGRVWVNNHAHVLRSRDGRPNQYLRDFINSIDLSPYVTGTAQPKLTQANMNGIPIPVPPADEQREIVRRVDQLFAFADRLEARVQTARKRVDALTQSILAKAFRGELVPTEAELAEAEGRPFESAQQLLNRIRSERETTAPTTPRKRTPCRPGINLAKRPHSVIT